MNLTNTQQVLRNRSKKDNKTKCHAESERQNLPVIGFSWHFFVLLSMVWDILLPDTRRQSMPIEKNCFVSWKVESCRAAPARLRVRRLGAGWLAAQIDWLNVTARPVRPKCVGGKLLTQNFSFRFGSKEILRPWPQLFCWGQGRSICIKKLIS